MKKLIIFNWKMNPISLKEAISLFEKTRIYSEKTPVVAEIVVAAPFVYLKSLAASVFAKGYGGLRFASQNCFSEEKGAYTGEISPVMLKKLGVEYVIIGHSERRKYLGETDEMINKKVLGALKTGLKVILCVGEDLLIRKRGLKAVKDFIKNQLKKDLKNIPLNSKSYILNSRLVIAYEPIWAIGTGNPCHSDDALEMIKFIKNTLNSKFYILNPKVLYGGSVDGKNIKNYVKYPEIDGALVGGASLKVKEVKKIIEYAQ